MEYYHYVNIFETKGLEYILVICFLVTFVLFVRRLKRPPRWQRPPSPPPVSPWRAGEDAAVDLGKRGRETAPHAPAREGGEGGPPSRST